MSKQYKSTMVELVDELHKLPQTDQIKEMIEEALVGEYHDFKNVKYACGKVESSQRLRQLGHPELAQRIEQGEFDEQADEEDQAMLRNDIKLNSSTPEEAEALAKMLGVSTEAAKTVAIEGRGEHIKNTLFKVQRALETNAPTADPDDEPALVYNKDKSIHTHVPFRMVKYLFGEHDDKIYCTAQIYENGIQFGRKIAPLSW